MIEEENYLKHQPGAGKKPLPDKDETPDKNELKDQEENEPNSGGGGFWKSQPQTTSQKNKGRFSGGGLKRYGILGIAVGAIVAIIIGIAAHFYSSTFKTIEVGTHLLKRGARSTLEYTRGTNTLVEDKIIADATTDAEMKNLLSKSRVGKAVNAFDPARAVRQMKSQGVFDVWTDPNTGRVSHYVLDGKPVAAPELKLGRFINNRRELNRVRDQLFKYTNQALLRDGQGRIVRTRAIKATLAEYGLKCGVYCFWKNRGADEKGQSTDEARRDAQKRIFEDVETTPKDVGGPTAKTDGADDAAEEGRQLERECLQNAPCADKAMQLSLFRASGADGKVTEWAKKVKARYSSPINNITLVYTVGALVCMVYDGSVKTSRAVIDAQHSAALKSFLVIVNAQDQQKPGSVTAEAVGGLNSFLGDVTDTNPEKLARNEPIDTTSEAYSQATRNQSYSIFNVIFPGALADAASAFAELVCPHLLDDTLFWSIIAGNLLISLLPGLGKVADRAIEKWSLGELERTAEKSFLGLIKSTIEKRFTKNALGGRKLKNQAIDFAKGNAAFIGAEEGLTYAANTVVEAEMGAFVNGADAADFVNQADMGAVIFNDTASRSVSLGRPMTNIETTKADTVANSYVLSLNSQKSFIERFFALSNPDSATAQGLSHVAAAESHPSNLIQSFLKIPASAASSLLNIWHGKAQAATDPNVDKLHYNEVEWGWTVDEQDKLDNDSSYDPLVNGAILDASGQSKAILDKYGVCFGYKDDGDGNAILDQSATVGQLLAGNAGNDNDNKIKRDMDTGNLVDDRNALCSPSNLTYTNQEFSPGCPDGKTVVGKDENGKDITFACNSLVFRWRVNQMYLNDQQELIDTQNPTSSSPVTSTSASNSTSAQNPANYIDINSLGQDSTDVPCAGGSQEMGKFDGYDNNQKVPIKLCAVDDLAVEAIDGDSSESIPGTKYYIQGANNRALVNSRVSTAVVAMVRAAKKAGVNIKALSSFRTMQHQTDAYNGSGKCPGPDCGYAKPGYSTHQMGLAIDFVDDNLNSSKKCKSRPDYPPCNDKGNPTWDWLTANAGYYQYQQLPPESWHWSPTGE